MPSFPSYYFSAQPQFRGNPQSAEFLKFPCPQCGKNYAWKTNMQRHLRLECGKEPQFQCPVCPYQNRPTDFQFSRSGVAFQNKRTTTGFYCYNCGRHYRWKHSLTAHLKNECGKEPSLQCPFCVYRAKQMSNFRRHIRVVHRQAVTI
ncbi:longitudinals lacking protein-like isoform X1 [Schistocerca gregaria]|uniref:longitudinals lacking protein-like isoform X1 n=1 Tax=Schistocerca gregaria TaxID=7010 RepID=UPI00211E41A5|nr:longitudinals lacking protein-like isoform X1 [Schistocerca gregaria]